MQDGVTQLPATLGTAGWGEGPGGRQPSPRTLPCSLRAQRRLHRQSDSPSTETVLGCT